jgi:hypothetical protein
MMRFLGSFEVASGAFYRASRHNVNAEISLRASVDERLVVCRRNVVEGQEMNGPIPQMLCLNIGDIYENISKYHTNEEARGRPNLVTAPRRFGILTPFQECGLLLFDLD